MLTGTKQAWRRRADDRGPQPSLGPPKPYRARQRQADGERDLKSTDTCSISIPHTAAAAFPTLGGTRLCRGAIVRTKHAFGEVFPSPGGASENTGTSASSRVRRFKDFAADETKRRAFTSHPTKVVRQFSPGHCSRQLQLFTCERTIICNFREDKYSMHSAIAYIRRVKTQARPQWPWLGSTASSHQGVLRSAWLQD